MDLDHLAASCFFYDKNRTELLRLGHPGSRNPLYLFYKFSCII